MVRTATTTATRNPSNTPTKRRTATATRTKSQWSLFTVVLIVSSAFCWMVEAQPGNNDKAIMANTNAASNANDGVSSNGMNAGNGANNSTTLDVASHCLKYMEISDHRDNRMDENEFAEFVAHFDSTYQGSTFDDLPDEVSNVFDEFQMGGVIHTTGSRPNQNASLAQMLFLYELCDKTTAALNITNSRDGTDVGTIFQDALSDWMNNNTNGNTSSAALLNGNAMNIPLAIFMQHPAMYGNHTGSGNDNDGNGAKDILYHPSSMSPVLFTDDIDFCAATVFFNALPNVTSSCDCSETDMSCTTEELCFALDEKMPFHNAILPQEARTVNAKALYEGLFGETNEEEQQEGSLCFHSVTMTSGINADDGSMEMTFCGTNERRGWEELCIQFSLATDGAGSDATSGSGTMGTCAVSYGGDACPTCEFCGDGSGIRIDCDTVNPDLATTGSDGCLSVADFVTSQEMTQEETAEHMTQDETVGLVILFSFKVEPWVLEDSSSRAVLYLTLQRYLNQVTSTITGGMADDARRRVRTLRHHHQQQRRQQRNLRVVLDEASVDFTEIIPCETDDCVTVIGSCTLAVTDEDFEAVYSQFTEAAQEGIDNGKVTEMIRSVDPDSEIVVMPRITTARTTNDHADDEDDHEEDLEEHDDEDEDHDRHDNKDEAGDVGAATDTRGGAFSGAVANEETVSIQVYFNVVSEQGITEDDIEGLHDAFHQFLINEILVEPDPDNTEQQLRGRRRYLRTSISEQYYDRYHIKYQPHHYENNERGLSQKSHHRRLLVNLQEDSIALTMMGPCPPGTTVLPFCLTIDGQYDLTVTDDDPEAVRERYTSATQNGVDDGTLGLMVFDDTSHLLVSPPHPDQIPELPSRTTPEGQPPANVDGSPDNDSNSSNDGDRNINNDDNDDDGEEGLSWYWMVTAVAVGCIVGFLLAWCIFRFCCKRKEEDDDRDDDKAASSADRDFNEITDKDDSTEHSHKARGFEDEFDVDSLDDDDVGGQIVIRSNTDSEDDEDDSDDGSIDSDITTESELERRQQFREQIEPLLIKYFPEKLPELDDTLRQFKGREEEVLIAVRARTNVERRRRYFETVEELIDTYFPEKKNQIDDLMDKFKGQEPALVAALKWRGIVVAKKRSLVPYTAPSGDDDDDDDDDDDEPISTSTNIDNENDSLVPYTAPSGDNDDNDDDEPISTSNNIDMNNDDMKRFLAPYTAASGDDDDGNDDDEPISTSNNIDDNNDDNKQSLVPYTASSSDDDDKDDDEPISTSNNIDENNNDKKQSLVPYAEPSDDDDADKNDEPISTSNNIDENSDDKKQSLVPFTAPSGDDGDDKDDDDNDENNGDNKESLVPYAAPSGGYDDDKDDDERISTSNNIEVNNDDKKQSLVPYTVPSGDDDKDDDEPISTFNNIDDNNDDDDNNNKHRELFSPNDGDNEQRAITMHVDNDSVSASVSASDGDDDKPVLLLSNKEYNSESDDDNDNEKPALLLSDKGKEMHDEDMETNLIDFSDEKNNDTTTNNDKATDDDDQDLMNFDDDHKKENNKQTDDKDWDMIPFDDEKDNDDDDVNRRKD